VIRNQYILAGLTAFFAVAGGIIYYVRMWLWNELHVKIQRALSNFYHQVFWSGIIRSGLELFYPSILFAMIKLYEKAGSPFWPAITLALFIGFFMGTMMHLQHKKPEVNLPEYLTKYGAYFTNVETAKKPQALHYSSIFLARRLFCALVIALLN
jgi:hypothetical protein